MHCAERERIEVVFRNNMAGRLYGTIVRVTKGHIYAHVEILWKEVPLSVIVTRTSSEDMELKSGDSVYVLIKGMDVLLAKTFSGILSARNKIRGTVKRIIQGDILSKVFLESQGDTFHAFITNTSLMEMEVNVGDEITAIVKSTELILSKELNNTD